MSETMLNRALNGLCLVAALIVAGCQGGSVVELDSIHYDFDFYDLTESIRGIPDELVVVDAECAFITASGHETVVEWNPSSGEVVGVLDFDGTTVELLQPAAASDGTMTGSVAVNFTSGVALSNGKLYISTSNYERAGYDPVNLPGTVLIFERDPSRSPPTYTPASVPFLVTTDFNPTEVTAFGPDLVLVTNTGTLAIRDGDGVPLGPASIDVIDTTSDRIVANIPLGMAAPGMEEIALTPDHTRGFLGSVSYNHVYELSLTGLYDLVGTEPAVIPLLDNLVIAGLDDPILVDDSPPLTADLVAQVVVDSKGERAYAASFNSGHVAVLNLGTVPATRRSMAIPVTEPVPNLGEVGPGPMAIRQGTIGVDFTGPDLFVLTGAPAGLFVPVITTDPPVVGEATTIGSPFPSDITIPEPESIRDFAFVLTSSPPMGVFRYHLDGSAGQGGGDIEDPEPVPGYAAEVVDVTYGAYAGFGQGQFPQIVLGPPKGIGTDAGGTDVLSLGRGGTITVGFGDTCVVDGPGVDLVVYENAFYEAGDPLNRFIETAIVEVSSDGIVFVPFPTSYDDALELGDPDRYTGYAGVEPVMPGDDQETNGGDRFDLADIGVDVARFVRITDTGGDPEDPGDLMGAPPLAGFDLDAVGGIHIVEECALR